MIVQTKIFLLIELIEHTSTSTTHDPVTAEDQSHNIKAVRIQSSHIYSLNKVTQNMDETLSHPYICHV